MRDSETQCLLGGTEEDVEVRPLVDTLRNIHPYFKDALESMVRDASN